MLLAAGACQAEYLSKVWPGFYAFFTWFVVRHPARANPPFLVQSQ
jgi:hypothetical protein